MDAAREDGSMKALEMGLAAKKFALRFFLGKYLSVLGGDFAPQNPIKGAIQAANAYPDVEVILVVCKSCTNLLTHISS